MNSLKHCATAIALLITAPLPVLAQDAPAEGVIVAIQGTQSLFRVPVEVAASLCQVETEVLVQGLATDPDLVICEVTQEVADRNSFTNDPAIQPFFSDDDEANDSDEDGIRDEDEAEVDGPEEDDATDDDATDEGGGDEVADEAGADEEAGDDAGAGADDGAEDDAGTDDGVEGDTGGEEAGDDAGN